MFPGSAAFSPTSSRPSKRRTSSKSGACCTGCTRSCACTTHRRRKVSSASCRMRRDALLHALYPRGYVVGKGVGPEEGESEMSYGMAVRVPGAFAPTVERVRVALKDQGFGVLTEIDVQATLRQKLDVGMEDYVILGACNPPLAKRALD